MILDRRIYIADNEYTNAQDFAASLGDLELNYELENYQTVDVSNLITRDMVRLAIEQNGTVTFKTAAEFGIKILNQAVFAINLSEV